MPALATLTALREQVRLLERPAVRHHAVLPFGVPAIDGQLPDGGLALAALHEVSSGGQDQAPAACATLFVAGLLARLDHTVLWCARNPDLFAPGLANAGLKPGRVLYAQAPDEKSVLAAMEEALRHAGLGAVVGEVSRLSMTASRRLVLAAEKSGIMALALRRPQARIGAVRPTDAAPNAARTRWRITPLPSTALAVPGIGRARWSVELTRARGGDPRTWIMEACDAQGCLAVPAELAHRPAAPAWERAA